jgi:acetyltransferase-like isoleucine patch superfamily enzyme
MKSNIVSDLKNNGRSILEEILSERDLTMKKSFLSEKELAELGIGHYGKNVLISRKASIYSPEKMTFGSNVRIDDFSILSGNIHIGSYVHIAAYCGLFGDEEKISIEDFAGLSARVLVYSFSDDYVFGLSLTNPTVPLEFKLKIDKGAVLIGKHVIIGAGSLVLPKTEIGIGAAVAALSLVRGDLDSWTIYKGNPAKAVGKRRSERILELEKRLRAQLGP